MTVGLFKIYFKKKKIRIMQIVATNASFVCFF